MPPSPPAEVVDPRAPYVTAIRVLVSFFVLALVAFLGFLAFHVDRETRFQRTQGTILEIQSRSHRGVRTNYVKVNIVYRYTLPDGRTHQASEETTLLDRPIFPAGQHITVYFNTSTPTDSFTELDASALRQFIFLFGFTALACGVGALIARLAMPRR